MDSGETNKVPDILDTLIWLLKILDLENQNGFIL